jgi:hypothetical protein
VHDIGLCEVRVSAVRSGGGIEGTCRAGVQRTQTHGEARALLVRAQELCLPVAGLETRRLFKAQTVLLPLLRFLAEVVDELGLVRMLGSMSSDFAVGYIMRGGGL